MLSDRGNWSKRSIMLMAGAFMLGIGAMAGIGGLLVSVSNHKFEAEQRSITVTPISATELDPAVWGHNFPKEYSSFLKMSDSSIRTPYGGSVPYSKLERYPVLKRIWAGYAFSVDYNEERGHYYALEDQKRTERIKVKKQPGACGNCHSADAPQLIEKMGWEEFNATPYDELKGQLHTGTSCADCHEPGTMELRITRPAFKIAMAERGIDLSKATRQEMRSYVCGQCHVEYFFKGESHVLTFPWKNGLSVDDIEAYYDEAGFTDWKHKETGAPMLKMQHPDFETWSSGIHGRSGVACADCHMPYTRDGAVKVSDHWIRSPLNHINTSCQPCHHESEGELRERVDIIQNRTAGLLRKTETAITDAMDAIIAAQKAGASDADLADARKLHRRAQMRWDFVFSENSTGFHSPEEAARVLANAIDYARQSQLAAYKTVHK